MYDEILIQMTYTSIVMVSAIGITLGRKLFFNDLVDVNDNGRKLLEAKMSLIDKWAKLSNPSIRKMIAEARQLCGK